MRCRVKASVPMMIRALVAAVMCSGCVGVAPIADGGAAGGGEADLDSGFAGGTAGGEATGGGSSGTDGGPVDAGPLDAGVVPMRATLFGGRVATTATAFQVRVVLDAPADQPYVVTWLASDGATLSAATSTIAAGQTRATTDVSWATPGMGRTVDFTIAPMLTLMGRPLTLDVATLTVPSYLQSAPLREWRQLANTAAPNEVRDYGGLAWRDDATGLEAWSLANGGHGGNLTNNRVMMIRLDVDTPAWVQRKAASDPTGWNLNGSTGPYFSDGTPAPRHTYWYNWWVPQKHRFMLLGGRFFGSGAYDHPVTDGFDPVTNAWDPAGTYPNHADRVTFIMNGEFMALSNEGYNRLNTTTMTWAGGRVSGTGTIVRAGHAHDTRRNKIFHLSSGDNWSVGGAVNTAVVDPTTWTKSAVTFNPSPAWTEFQAAAMGFLGSTLVYDADADCFYFYNGGAEGPQKVFRVTPNATTTWDMDVLPVTGLTPAGSGGGVHTKFYYSSRLRTIFLIVGNQGVYYLRLG